MNYTVTITKSGQITVPKSIREFLGVQPGQRLVFQRRSDAVVLEKGKTAEEVSREIQALIPDYVRKNAKKDTSKTTGQIRNEWLKSDEAKRYYQERFEATL